jgi:hypothetical protein
MITIPRGIRTLVTAALVVVALVAVPTAAGAAATYTSLPAKCSAVLPTRTFVVLPGLTTYRPYSPPTPLYGVSDPSHLSIILSHPNITCSWAVPGETNKQRFTITETILKSSDVSALQSWYSSHGITPYSVGGDPLNLWYSVPTPVGHEVHVLFPRGYWYTILDKSTGYTPGAITQDAIDMIYALNPGLFL